MTKNTAYNELLISWAKQGYPSPPMCEECSKDLIGQDVVDTGNSWVCTECASHFEGGDYRTHAQDARAERRQMGFES